MELQPRDTRAPWWTLSATVTAGRCRRAARDNGVAHSLSHVEACVNMVYGTPDDVANMTRPD
eukprot:714250-Pyramimonas_sp.AAC.1